MLKHEGIFTLIKSLDRLPYEKQEEFLNAQRTWPGDVIVVRKSTGSFELGVVGQDLEKSNAGEVVPPNTEKRHDSGEDFEDGSQDTIPNKSEGDGDLEKGAPVTSKKYPSGKVTQVHYKTKPETRHYPKAGEETRYTYDEGKQEVSVGKEKATRKRIPATAEHEEELKEASTTIADLNKAFDEFWAKSKEE